MDELIKELARRVGDLENKREEDLEKWERKRESDLEKINDNNRQLTMIVTELKNLTSKISELASNWENALKRTEEYKIQEHNVINKKIDNMELEIKTLKGELDNRTTKKLADAWEKLKWLFIGGAVGLFFVIAEKFMK